MKTSTWKIYSFFTSSGYYKKDVMNVDLETHRDLYFNNGYVRLLLQIPRYCLPKTARDDNQPSTFRKEINTGYLQYPSLPIKPSPKAELRGRITASPGAIFSKEVVRADIASITDLYTQNGYALASVYPDIVPDDAQNNLALL